MRFFLPLLIMFCAIPQAFGAAKALYFVGGFNNWDISHPVVAAVSGGMSVTDIDFSGNKDFKVSTVDPEGSWTKFDEGTLYPSVAVEEDKWIAVEERPVSPNITAPHSKIYTVKFDLDNMRMMFSTGTGDTPWSGTLPVMFINTENNAAITSKETYVKGTYYLDPMGVEGVEAVATAEAPAALQIRGRGNYTWWGFDKKPYRLKLDKKAALMGMDKSKHFALLAHADDSAAGLRNALGFACSQAIGMPWTPATAPLEVVLNGDYIGLYWLTETVRVDEDRVDVVEQADGATTEVDGGWLVEIDNYDSDPHVTVKDSNGNPIWFTYKSPEVLSPEQESYLTTAMQSIQNAANACDEDAAAELVDFDILARYFIVNQVMYDMESFHGSCYLNRQRGLLEKWNFGPVWDFGNSFNPQRADKPRFIFDYPDFSQVWIGEFYKMPRFVSTVKTVWADFLNEGPETLTEVLGTDADRIAAAAVNDARRWPQYSHSDVLAQAQKLQDWLEISIDWLKDQWGNEAGMTDVEFCATCVKVTDGGVIVSVSCDSDIVVAMPDGRSQVYNVRTGDNRIDLAPGLYIVDGVKVAVRR